MKIVAPSSTTTPPAMWTPGASVAKSPMFTSCPTGCRPRSPDTLPEPDVCRHDRLSADVAALAQADVPTEGRCGMDEGRSRGAKVTSLVL